MTTTDNIFALEPGNTPAFERTALETFRFQADRCAVYREYLDRIGVIPAEVTRIEQIPFLPIELFKRREVYAGDRPPEIVFTSSNTGGTIPSRHFMQSLAHYEKAFLTAFRTFYGDPAGWSLYGLLPNYLQREGSSLVYMADRLIAACGSGGFYLDDYEKLLADMARDPKPKILLGVSYALWDLAERYAPKFENTVVMETGGMKGHREELPKARFHRILCEAFGVESIHSEYGMAELTSQAYSSGSGIFRTPGWMRVLVRDRSLRHPPGRCAGRDRHHRPGQPLLLRLHPDAGHRPRLRRRQFRNRRTYRPQRHTRLQPAGTVNTGASVSTQKGIPRKNTPKRAA